MEIIIDEDYSRYIIDIYIKENQGNRTIITGYDGENLVQTDVSEAKPYKIKPLLSIPLNMYNDILEAFANKANEKNIRTENENHLKGKLEATEKHLEDMRKAFDKLLNKE